MTRTRSAKSLVALAFSILLVSVGLLPTASPKAVGTEVVSITTDWVLPNSVKWAYNYDQPSNVLRRDGALARTDLCCGLLAVHDFTPVDIPANVHIDQVEIRFHLAGVRTTYRFQQFDPSFVDCVDHEKPGYYKGFTPASEEVLDDYIVNYTAQDCTIRPEVVRSGDYYVEIVRYWGGNANYVIDDIAVRFTYTQSAPPADSDDDGLLDDWETNGLTFDPDGPGPVFPQYIDLPAMGADRNKPDIFVQVDSFTDSEHSHELSPAAIKLVVDAFAAAPFVSRAGSVGINLHVDHGPSSIMDYTTSRTWGWHSRANQLPHVERLGTGGANYDWTAFQGLKDAHFTPTGRGPVFHYTVAAHYYGSTSSSGISRGIGASDFIVSLAGYTDGVGSVQEQAGTFMHELGHNLGLRHGGSGDDNYKPNYLSVMNYAFQTAGLIKNGVAGTMDYSRQVLPSLDEAHLDESTGIRAAGYGTVYSCPDGTFATVRDVNRPIDWDCNGDTDDTDLHTDINGDNEHGRLSLNPPTVCW